MTLKRLISWRDKNCDGNHAEAGPFGPPPPNVLATAKREARWAAEHANMISSRTQLEYDKALDVQLCEKEGK